jgi:hypothetical protein
MLIHFGSCGSSVYLARDPWLRRAKCGRPLLSDVGAVRQIDTPSGSPRTLRYGRAGSS